MARILISLARIFIIIVLLLGGGLYIFDKVDEIEACRDAPKIAASSGQILQCGDRVKVSGKCFTTKGYDKGIVNGFLTTCYENEKGNWIEVTGTLAMMSKRGYQRFLGFVLNRESARIIEDPDKKSAGEVELLK